MTPSQKHSLRLSEVRERLNVIGALESDAYTDAIKAEETALQGEYKTLETRYRSALIAEGEGETKPAAPDAEKRERVELRGKAQLTNYLRAALAGRRVDGPEAELSAAAGIGDGIPLELWDTQTENRAEHRVDAPTGAPSTVGVNLDSIRPAVFSNSIAPRLGIEMPRVASGSYASATIATSLTASSQAKGGESMATAATFTVSTVTPKRISARLGIRIEDVASVGQANFESILRENLSLILSDELDDQAINGSGGNSGADLNGIFQALADPAAAPSAIADFDEFASAHAAGIDGLWANTLKDVSIVCGPATMTLAARTFQSAAELSGRAERGGLRDDEHRRILDQQADAGCCHVPDGFRCATGDPVPHGPLHDGRRGRDANRRLPALERGINRRYLLWLGQGRAVLHDARPVG